MPAHNSWQLVVATMQSAASSFQKDADDALSRLEDDSSSNVVNVSRFARMQLVMTAVGGFSMLEGILEQSMGWTKPYQELEQRLRESGHASLADTLMTFKMAINVLKHGYGESYERLKRRSNLPFRVKLPEQQFFDEGDVSEIPGLILADHRFVHSCARVIEQAFTSLQIPSVEIS